MTVNSEAETPTLPAAETQKPKNPFAITGMILGIASVFLYAIGILPILAIVFSAIGLGKVKSYAGGGKVQSWVGLILGILYTLMYMRAYGHLGQ